MHINNSFVLIFQNGIVWCPLPDFLPFSHLLHEKLPNQKVLISLISFVLFNVLNTSYGMNILQLFIYSPIFEHSLCSSFGTTHNPAINTFVLIFLISALVSMK